MKWNCRSFNPAEKDYAACRVKRGEERGELGKYGQVPIRDIRQGSRKPGTVTATVWISVSL